MSFVRRSDAYERRFRAGFARALDAQVQPFLNELAKQSVLHQFDPFLYVEDYHVNNNLTAMMMYIGQREAAMMQAELDMMIKKKSKPPSYKRTMQRFIREQTQPLHDEISTTTKRRLTKYLGQAIDEKMTVKQAVKFIDKEMKTVRDFRTKRIVRTEVARAMNFGRMMGTLATGYDVSKKWVATLDHRTRHTHRKLNGTKKSILQPFYTENGQIWMPNDPNAPPEETINCRCSLQYIPMVRGGKPVMMSQDKLLKLYTSGDEGARLVINEMLANSMKAIHINTF